MRCITLKFNFESENGFQKESIQLTSEGSVFVGQETETMTSKLQALGAALSACAGLEDFRERVKDGFQLTRRWTPITVVWCWRISPYNWWIIAWVGQVQWPQTPKRFNTHFVHTKQLAKELKDELQKKADASKFGSLFSNITWMVVVLVLNKKAPNCSWPKVVSWKVKCLWINPDFLIPQGISN